MVGADEVAPRFERWAAETAPGLAARRAGVALVVAAGYLLAATRLFHSALPNSYSTTLTPLSQCSTWLPVTMSRVLFH